MVESSSHALNVAKPIPLAALAENISSKESLQLKEETDPEAEFHRYNIPLRVAVLVEEFCIHFFFPLSLPYVFCRFGKLGLQNHAFSGASLLGTIPFGVSKFMAFVLAALSPTPLHLSLIRVELVNLLLLELIRNFLIALKRASRCTVFHEAEYTRRTTDRERRGEEVLGGWRQLDHLRMAQLVRGAVVRQGVDAHLPLIFADYSFADLSKVFAPALAVSPGFSLTPLKFGGVAVPTQIFTVQLLIDRTTNHAGKTSSRLTLARFAVGLVVSCVPSVSRLLLGWPPYGNNIYEAVAVVLCQLYCTMVLPYFHCLYLETVVLTYRRLARWLTTLQELVSVYPSHRCKLFIRRFLQAQDGSIGTCVCPSACTCGAITSAALRALGDRCSGDDNGGAAGSEESKQGRRCSLVARQGEEEVAGTRRRRLRRLQLGGLNVGGGTHRLVVRTATVQPQSQLQPQLKSGAEKPTGGGEGNPEIPAAGDSGSSNGEGAGEEGIASVLAAASGEPLSLDQLELPLHLPSNVMPWVEMHSWIQAIGLRVRRRMEVFMSFFLVTTLLWLALMFYLVAVQGHSARQYFIAGSLLTVYILLLLLSWAAVFRYGVVANLVIPKSQATLALTKMGISVSSVVPAAFLHSLEAALAGGSLYLSNLYLQHPMTLAALPITKGTLQLFVTAVGTLLASLLRTLPAMTSTVAPGTGGGTTPFTGGNSTTVVGVGS